MGPGRLKGGVVGGSHMVRARWRNGEAHPLADLPARIVHGELLPFDVKGKFLRTLADLCCRGLDAIGQKIAQSRFTESDPLDALYHCVGITECELDPLRIGFGEDALFKAFHGKTDRHSGGDGVQCITVAQLMPLGDSLQVVDAQKRPKAAQGFVFRAAVGARCRIGAGGNFHHPFAAYGARITALFTRQDGFGHPLAADLLRTFKEAGAEIVRRKDALGVQ